MNGSGGRTWREDPPFVLSEEYWANSQFSIARYYGRIRICGHPYTICDRQGRDIFTLSMIAHKEGKDKAIEPGETADLVLDEFIPVYRKIGRDGVVKMLQGRHMTLEEAYKYAGIEMDNNNTNKSKNHGRR